MKCRRCDGTGKITWFNWAETTMTDEDQAKMWKERDNTDPVVCWYCKGSGEVNSE